MGISLGSFRFSFGIGILTFPRSEFRFDSAPLPEGSLLRNKTGIEPTGGLARRRGDAEFSPRIALMGTDSCDRNFVEQEETERREIIHSQFPLLAPVQTCSAAAFRSATARGSSFFAGCRRAWRMIQRRFLACD